MQISMLNKKNLYEALATLMSVKENGVDCAEYKKRQRKKKKKPRKLECPPTVFKKGT